MDSALSIVLLLGWLALAGSALASYRLNWRKGAVYGLAWFGIFLAVATFMTAVRS